ncbi:amidohydrolase family protein [uncultured Oscillibacter sp.]|uniref:N-acyl-D-amino-acid deacylase family protein n=1 Tax=uncultured Oscillibacter sp. TaxID=876091 RepID=UPI0025EF61E5|nr:amidohydrolase family protein [uncultured Oscillibacter sp.]
MRPYEKRPDILIKHGRVIDGTGNPAYFADVAIVGDRIDRIGRLDGVEADLVIDAAGKYVTPGFIDEHSHSDSTIWANPEAQSSIRQGVTTEIVGHCGLSESPITQEVRSRIAVGLISADAKPPIGGFREAFAAIEHMGISENMAWLVGHNTLRHLAGVYGPTCTEEQFRQMETYLRQSLEAGCVGFSTGLEFEPGRQATREEVSRLVGVLAEYDGIYTSHIRNRDSQVLESIQEFLETLREHPVRGVLSHFNIRMNTGAPEDAWRRGNRMLHEARAAGLDILSDMTPIEFGIGQMQAILPAWAMEGGWQGTCRILQDPAQRQRLRGDCDRYWRFITRGEWDRVRMQSCPNFPEIIGMTFPEIAALWHKDEWECFFDILAAAEEQMASCIMLGHLFPEQMVIDGITDPMFMMVVDGFTTTEGGSLAEKTAIPLHYMGMMYFFAHYVRDLRVMPLETAVRKVTSLPASFYRLEKRGLLQEGCYADINVFALEDLTIRSTFENPCVYSQGMDYVLVNGVPVIAQGRHTHRRPGRSLLRT